MATSIVGTPSLKRGMRLRSAISGYGVVQDGQHQVLVYIIAVAPRGTRSLWRVFHRCSEFANLREQLSHKVSFLFPYRPLNKKINAVLLQGFRSPAIPTGNIYGSPPELIESRCKKILDGGSCACTWGVSPACLHVGSLACMWGVWPACEEFDLLEFTCDSCADQITLSQFLLADGLVLKNG